MKYAWIENNKIRDIVEVDPFTIFHADVAKNYSTKVEDNVEDNAELVDGVLRVGILKNKKEQTTRNIQIL